VESQGLCCAVRDLQAIIIASSCALNQNCFDSTFILLIVGDSGFSITVSFAEPVSISRFGVWGQGRAILGFVASITVSSAEPVANIVPFG
jgi:hypothetical protein